MELAGGTFNDALIDRGKWVARFPRADLADARRRARALQRIGQLDLPFAVPEVLEDRLDLPDFYERARTHAAMFPLTGAVSALRQGGDPAKFLAWFRRRCAVREHPPAS